MCDHSYKIDPLHYNEATEGVGETLEEAIRNADRTYRENHPIYREQDYIEYDLFHRVGIVDGVIRYTVFLRVA